MLVLSLSLVTAVPAAANGGPATLHVSKWTEYATNPVFNPTEKAYYPTILFDGTTYQMWYADETGIRYTTSSDGITWATGVSVTGLADNANHPLVEYIVGGKYIIWYWAGDAVLYSISAIRYAESTDGTTWVNDQPLQNGTTVPMISGVAGEWNGASYGPIDVLYNSTAPNTGGNPFDYSFAMYFDGTNYDFEEIGLGYSPDGISWSLYGKVLARGNGGAWGNTDNWDSSYTTFGTIIKEADGKWHMWYSGGQLANKEGIGYAHSSDGLNWVRDASNPIMHQSDGVSWRADRTYTPRVIKDGSVYKMWFSGKDAGGNYAIGYATNTNLDAHYKTIQAAIDAASSGDTINVAAGTYTEQVTVNKSVTLTSDTGNYRTTGTILTGSGRFFTLEDGVRDITIQGFRFENIAVASEGVIYSPGVTTQNNITIQSNSFIKIACPAVGLYGVTGGLPQARSGWLITDNKIDNLTGPSTSGSGLWVSQLSDSTISNNQISNTTYAGMILEILQNVVISGNTISDTPSKGIQVAKSPKSNVTITGNYITNTNKNNVADEGAISIYPDTSNIQIVGNSLTDNYQGFTVRNKSGVAADVYVNFNNISGNGGFGVGNFAQGGGTLNATNNWWGDTSGPGGEGPGTGDEVSTNVDYEPWLEVSVEDALVGTITDGTLDNLAGADTEVIVTGSATVTAARYSGNPGSGFSGDTGKYIDVHIDDATGVTEIEIRVYYTAAEIDGLVETSLSLRWWDGTSWVLCSDSGVNTTDIPGPPAYSGYMWARIRSDTTPTLAQLTGSVFGGGGALVSSPVWGGDTTAPRISNVLTYYGGVTETTADICADISWRTNEQSTSQVEYEASPSMLSPLDMSYVNEHHVHLTGLTPCTTYNYRTMSMDRAGNLAVSDLYTFTTLGEAAFTSSDLSISPSEVDIGQSVTISALVTNTSSCLGSHSVTLKINDVVEATSELTLDAGASESVSFTVSREAAGNYSVVIDELSGSFTVTEPDTSPPAAPEDESTEAESPVNWPLIGGVIAGVVVIGLIIFFVVRRRAA